MRLKEVKNLTITTHEMIKVKRFLGFYAGSKKETRLFIQADLIVEGDIQEGDVLKDANGVDFYCIGNNEIVIIQQVVDSFELSDEFIVVSRSFKEFSWQTNKGEAPKHQ